jgi:hypothetical protein
MMLWQTIYVFIIPILSLIGFIFNLLCTIVFSLIIKNGQRDDMFKHFLLKSICEMFGCGFSVFRSIYHSYSPLSYSFIMVVWYIWFHKFITKALLMASTEFEIAATFNCAISIEKQMKWCEKRLSFWFSVTFIVIISFGVELFPVLTYYIIKYDSIDSSNKTVREYFPNQNNLVFKLEKFGLAESIIKEVVFLLILLSLNIYILFKLIQIGQRKKRLTSTSSNVQNRAERRKILMIIVLFSSFLLGHLPNFLYFGFRTYHSLLFWTDFKDWGEIFLYFSYSTSFFVYYSFNKTFKRFFLKIIQF